MVKVSATDTIGNSDNNEEIVLTVESAPGPELVSTLILALILVAVIVSVSLVIALFLIKRR